FLRPRARGCNDEARRRNDCADPSLNAWRQASKRGRQLRIIRRRWPGRRGRRTGRRCRRVPETASPAVSWGVWWGVGVRGAGGGGGGLQGGRSNSSGTRLTGGADGDSYLLGPELPGSCAGSGRGPERGGRLWLGEDGECMGPPIGRPLGK